MPISGKPLRQAIAADKATPSFNPWLVALALALCAAVFALLVDRDGLVGGLHAAGRAFEYGARLIASVEIPFG